MATGPARGWRNCIHGESTSEHAHMHGNVNTMASYSEPSSAENGPTYLSVKKRFIPSGTILHQKNLELLMGRFYTSTTLMYSRDCFTPV